MFQRLKQAAKHCAIGGPGYATYVECMRLHVEHTVAGRRVTTPILGHTRAGRWLYDEGIRMNGMRVVAESNAPPAKKQQGERI